jgi:tRNA pseudouridine55 synthase
MDGIILCDKPPGMTSHDVVAALRRRLGGARTGHAGTLDPFASGLLLVLVGRATRVQRFVVALPKTYRVVARLGARSSTGDPEGDVTVTGVLPPDPPELPTGTVRQRPPAHSAVKVAGVRAYRRARRGEVFELPERDVHVYHFQQLWREGERAEFEIVCSAGTYVRSLIADLGDAYCEQLRRTAIGPFTVKDAIPVSTGPARGAEEDHPIASPARQPDFPATRTDPPALEPVPLGQALSFLPRVELDGELARWASHGRAVAVAALSAALRTEPGQAVLLVDADGAIAIAEARAGAQGPELKPVVGLRG